MKRSLSLLTLIPKALSRKATGSGDVNQDAHASPNEPSSYDDPPESPSVSYLDKQLAGLFDKDYYLTKYPDVEQSDTDPLAHFLEHGRFEMRRASAYFDPEYYLDANPDVKESGQEPHEHYIINGSIEGRLPSENGFDSVRYLKTHPEARKSEDIPLVHFILTGGHREKARYDPGFENYDYYLKDSFEPEDSLELRSSRPAPEELAAALSTYDVVSFDVFDTALLRTVYEPTDVFRLVGLIIGDTQFHRRRVAAETSARRKNFNENDSHEINLDQIYDIYYARYGGDVAKLRATELEVEKLVARPNPYIHQLYEHLISAGKIVVFVSDMYLSHETIANLLSLCGYDTYDFLWVSNEIGGSKADGTLSRKLVEAFPGKEIAHVGDNLVSDVQRMRRVGIKGIYYPDIRGIVPSHAMETLPRSFYESLIASKFTSGIPRRKGIHWDYGYRVAGVLATGYAQFIEAEANRRNIDKILFCGRDCFVIQQVYYLLNGSRPSSYIEVSRRALDLITLEYNFDDFLHRSVLPYFDHPAPFTRITDILSDANIDYLTPELGSFGIDHLAAPQDVDRQEFIDFIWSNKDIIINNHEDEVAAARLYFGNAIGDAQKILVVDIGWSGTIIQALRRFVNREFAERNIQLVGALMCTSDNADTIDAVSSDELCAYIYSPFANHDLKDLFYYPGIDSETADRVRMNLEYTFTSKSPSTISYAVVDDIPVPVHGTNYPTNPEQIDQIHDGTLQFVRDWVDHIAPFTKYLDISPYIAFSPFRHAINNLCYAYLIFKDFRDDVLPTSVIALPPYGAKEVTFGERYPRRIQMLAELEYDHTEEIPI